MGKFLVSLKQLESWFERQKRVLPWRDEPSIYRVWISEIMLQQTQVATVIPYFEKFLSRFPSVQVLADAPEEDVMLHWAGLGYYSRARNLHRAAMKIVEKGYFPKNREEWLEVPGVGNYTAGAVLSIAQDEVEAILDGNVERVLSRVRRVSRSKGDSAFKDRLWRLSQIFVTSAAKHQIRPSSLNQALMELGATVCSPKKPKCLLCPMTEICQAYQYGNPEEFPPKKKPKEWLKVDEKLSCIINPRGEILLRQRQKGEWRSGLWDLIDQDAKKVSKNLVFVGEFKSNYVVTRHKVTRTTQVWEYFKATHLQAAEDFTRPDFRWVSLDQPDVPVGAPLKKTCKGIRLLFDERASKSKRMPFFGGE